MQLFLTSSPGGNYIEDGRRFPCPLDNSNCFVDNLRMALPKRFRCLMISSDPEDAKRNDSILQIMQEAFQMSGLPMEKSSICDDRNCDKLAEMIADADFIILCGGHVPTQNAFFQKIDLKKHLADFAGVVMGISAGTMNSAGLVYAQPELEGEAIDPAYRRFIDGLGLTEIRVLPHFQYLCGLTLDGQQVMDISLQDSREHAFYGLVDGSYIHVKNGKTILYGEAYYFSDGKMEQICKENEQL
ncbi:MAG: Type 1 glutamine amidotransferase-like domain-containing protein, partial [Lachnospiraceae bacterium]